VAPEQIAVVVHDEARNVLWQTRDSTAPAERVHRLGIEVLERERVRPPSSLLERLEHVLGRELAVEAVIDQEDVGRVPGRERGRKPREQILPVARLDELHVRGRLALLVGGDHVAVRLELLRVAEHEEAHGAAVPRRSATGGGRQHCDREQRGQRPSHPARRCGSNR
jgi:hypothetical protein